MFFFFFGGGGECSWFESAVLAASQYFEFSLSKAFTSLFILTVFFVCWCIRYFLFLVVGEFFFFKWVCGRVEIGSGEIHMGKLLDGVTVNKCLV